MADNQFNPAHVQAYATAFVQVMEAVTKLREQTEPDTAPPEGADLPPLYWDHALVAAHDEIVERIEAYKKVPSPSPLVPGKVEGLTIALRVIEKHLPEEERRGC